MKKFAIVYGQMETGLQKRAVQELTTILLDYTLDFPVCLAYDPDARLSDYRCIYIGTKQNNAYIQKNSTVSLSHDEEYHMTVENDSVVIEGYDDAGVLYGVLDFYHKYIVKYEHPDTDEYWINFLLAEHLPSFTYGSYPAVKQRGLWTWGHVIYDYKGYFDHMMKLKMNCVIIWNDFVPVNAKDILEYAHDRNIKVVWGFPWLWDTECAKFDLNDLDGKSEEIFAKYEREFAGVEGDGIYFQTFTELNEDNIGGVLIAQAAADFVNRTAALFYEKYPNMELQFGLHATSVKSKLDFIRTVDPRIRIVWENCGAFPFSYVPNDIADFDQTMYFVSEIAYLRGKQDCFGAVTKGLVKLDWSQFEHPEGPQFVGVSSDYVKQNRTTRKARIWKYIQACWIAHADKAYEMVRHMRSLKDGDLWVTALVEDGMFEQDVMYPVALFAEMLWDCQGDIKQMTSEVAMRSYVRFS